MRIGCGACLGFRAGVREEEALQIEFEKVRRKENTGVSVVRQVSLVQCVDYLRVGAE